MKGITCAPSFLLLTAVASGPSTLLVPEQFPAVQAAIQAAVDGDTVLVSPGTYFENLDFSGKDIEVRSRHGARVTVLDGA